MEKENIWDQKGYTDVIICAVLSAAAGEFVLVNSGRLLLFRKIRYFNGSAIAYQQYPIIAITGAAAGRQIIRTYIVARKRLKVLRQKRGQAVRLAIGIY